MFLFNIGSKKEMIGGIAFTTVNWFRPLLNGIICLNIILFLRKNPANEIEGYKITTLARSAFGQLSFTIYAICLWVLPLTLLSVLFNMYPFFTALIAVYTFNDHITRSEVFAILVCIAGVVLILIGNLEDPNQTYSLYQD